ncbi:hypothetical protein NN4_60950 [Nocardia ninae NBRC 108245]|uniref:Uncharacterized protein n=1 Tax=Nocardia ninae NBRC 108245 TaxID=1210091 RepID=A0A511MNN8_9NOCA|nr:hypothetical protein NN4_60950 [Nocardia ninae NBRC 108245]
MGVAAVREVPGAAVVVRDGSGAEVVTEGVATAWSAGAFDPQAVGSSAAHSSTDVLA